MKRQSLFLVALLSLAAPSWVSLAQNTMPAPGEDGGVVNFNAWHPLHDQAEIPINHMRVEWERADSALFYQLYRGVDGSWPVEFRRIEGSAVAADLHFVTLDSALQEGRTYSYYVAAVTPSETLWAGVRVFPAQLKKPTFEVIKVDSSKITFKVGNFGTFNPAREYLEFYYLPPGFSYWESTCISFVSFPDHPFCLRAMRGDTLTFKLPGAKVGEWRFQVWRRIVPDFLSGLLASVSAAENFVVITGTTQSVAPHLFPAEFVDGGIRWTWTSVPGAEGYLMESGGREVLLTSDTVAIMRYRYQPSAHQFQTCQFAGTNCEYILAPGDTGSVVVRPIIGGALGPPSNSQFYRIPSGPAAIGEPATVPTEYALLQNYPNPFNPETTIKYQLPVADHVRLSIYTVLGQEVRRLIDRSQAAAHHVVVWDGRNNAGNTLPSGVYFYRLESGSFTAMKKMILMK